MRVNHSRFYAVVAKEGKIKKLFFSINIERIGSVRPIFAIFKSKETHITLDRLNFRNTHTCIPKVIDE